jgi:glycosyltransferase involved in cell wall biosynthesis/SAM-dependent methyltransferase
MPEFDREGGSRRVFHFLEFFKQAGWNVAFAAENGTGGERYAQTLQRMGVPTYAIHHPWKDGEDAIVDFDVLITAGKYDLVLFVFWTSAETYMARVRAASPATTVVVDSIDINFLRQSRKVFCEPGANGRGATLGPDYAQEMTREVNTYAGADAVLTVSEKESELVDDFTGRHLAYAVPLAEDLDVSAHSFAERRGMVFVGNFRHPPNVQAVEYLCQEILPRISADIRAEHPLYIVGNDPNEAVLKASHGLKHVHFVGWVPSVLPYVELARVSVVPLLYGAGTKTKLIQSLMIGTPSVSTNIGIEGLNLRNNEHVLVAEDATWFAASITRLIGDEALWGRLAEQGRNFILNAHGYDAVSTRFNDVLSQISSNVGSRPVFCEELRPSVQSEFDGERDETIRRYALERGRLSGFCNVVDSETEFIVASDNLRESVVAQVSSSINRHRQLVCALSMALFGNPHVSLPDIGAAINRRNLRVYVAETNSVLPNALKRELRPDLLVCSEYLGPEHESGEIVQGILNQDLQKTSFDDESFDVIITSEVFEHIPDAISAEKEVMRILRTGGVYCFTVPFLPAGEHDVVLAEMDPQGQVEYFAEPQFHSDPIRPDEGALVYRLFSFTDLKQRFGDLGHEFKSYRFWSEPLGILGNDAWAHTVRKSSNGDNRSRFGIKA